MANLQPILYMVKDEDGNQIGEYTSHNVPPFKGEVIQLNEIPGYDEVEVLSVSWISSRVSNSVIMKVRPAK